MLKALLKHPLPLAILTLLITQSDSFAYDATRLSSEKQAQSFYDMLPTQSFKGRSGCFQRAHYWSYLLSEHYSVKSMKIFLFFTNRYKREFDYRWTYHVAPLIPTQMNDGSTQELVFDPTFTQNPNPGATTSAVYDNKPLPIQEWLRYFIYPNTECKVITNYDEFVQNQDLEYCYLMKAPMYNYIPRNFVEDQEGLFGAAKSDWYDAVKNERTNWRLGDIDQMFNALSEHATYSDKGN